MAGQEKWPEFLQSYPCLWNPQDPDFSNESVKEACLEQLLAICNVQSSVPIYMESLKQWLAGNVRPEFQTEAGNILQPSLHDHSTPEGAGDAQPESMPHLKDLVIEFPCLWDPKDPNYKKYSMRERCKRQLLAKCNSLSPTVITMSTLRRQLASLCSQMRRQPKLLKTAKRKYSLLYQNVEIALVPVPAPLESIKPLQIISPPGIPTQRVPSIEEGVLITSQCDTPVISIVLPQVTTASTPPVVPESALSENDQNLLKELEKYRRRSHRLRKREEKTPQAASETPPETAVSENDQNLLKEIENNETKRKEDEKTKQPTLSTLAEEFPCLWDPDHPYHGFSAVRNLSLELLLVKYNDTFSEKITMAQLRRRMRKRAQRVACNRNKKQAKDQQIIQNTTKKISQRLSEDLELLEISSNSDSDQPLIKYNREHQDQKSEISVTITKITDPNTEIAVPATEITVPNTEITDSTTEITTATETSPLFPETARSEDDQNSLEETEEQKKGEKKTLKGTLATLVEEFPCLWHPDHPHFGFGAVKTLSLQLLLVKYNDVLKKQNKRQCTLLELKKKMRNLAKKMRKRKIAWNGVIHDSKVNASGEGDVSQTSDCPKKQKRRKEKNIFQNTTVENFQPLPDTLTPFEISSDSDEPLSNYKHHEPRNREATETTLPNMEMTVLDTDITAPDTENIALNTGITGPITTIALPNTGITVPNPAIAVPNTGITVTNPVITVPNIGITSPIPAVALPNTGITVPNPAIAVRNTGITVPIPAITLPNTRITIPNPAITVPTTEITIPNTEITAPSTETTVPVISFNWCRVCGDLKNDCTDVFVNTRPYFTRTNFSLVFNDHWAKLDFTHKTLPKTICEDCHKKLLDIYAFVKHVKDIQATFNSLDRKRKSGSEVDTESEHISGGKKFKITIDFNSDKPPTLSDDENDCVEIGGSSGIETVDDIDPYEVARVNSEVIDLSFDDDIEMKDEVEKIPLLSTDVELTEEVSERSKAVSVDISSQSPSGYENRDIPIICKVEASPPVTDTNLVNDVDNPDNSFKVPVNIVSQSTCLNGSRWVEVGPISVNYENIKNEETEQLSEIGDINSPSPCVDETSDTELLPATDTNIVNENVTNKSKVSVDNSSTNTVYSYKVNDKDFIGVCTDTGRGSSDTLVNNFPEPADLNLHPISNVNGAVSKYRHLLLDSLSLDTGKKNRVVSVDLKSNLSPSCNDDDRNNDVVSKLRPLSNSHSLNGKSTKVTDQSIERVVTVVKSKMSPSNNDYDGNGNNDLESKYKHLLLDSLSMSSESAKETELKNNSQVSIHVKSPLSPPCDNDENVIESKFRPLLLNSLPDADSAKVGEQKNNTVVSIDVKSHISSNNDDNENKCVESHKDTDSKETDNYEKFIKEVLLQAINSAGISIRNSGESKCVQNGTIVNVKKEINDDINRTDEET